MKREDAEEFTQSLGQIVGGSWRQVALADRLGVPKALGFSSLRDWVQDRLGGYVKLAIPERREAVRELTADGRTGEEVAEVLGISPRTVDREKAPNGAQVRKTAEDARKAVLANPVDPAMIPGVYFEDFYTGSHRISDDSVDLVFTDPPYDRDSVDLYRKAAQVAARILKPGGSLVAYSGQKYLPEVYGLINHPALKYWWTFAGVHAGAHQMLQKLGVRCGWKPIVWYVKGTRGDVSEVLADVVSGAREKSHHEWQQAEAEALHFIEKLTFAGGLVVDFFLGGGTTKVAAEKLGRRFIGFEIDRTRAAAIASRVAA